MVLQVKQNVTHIQTVSKLKSWNDEDGARTAGRVPVPPAIPTTSVQWPKASMQRLPVIS